MEITQTITRASTFHRVLVVAGLAMVAVYILSHLFELPDPFLSIFAVSYVFYVPFGIGTLAIKLCMIVKGLREYVFRITYPDLIIKWILGLLIIVALAYFLPLLSETLIHLLGPILLFVSFASCIKFAKVVGQANNSILKILLVALLIGLSFGIYVRSFSPYPLTPGIDTFTHIYTAKNTLNGTAAFSPLVYVPSVDILIAISSQTFDADFVGVFWTGSIFLFAIFAIAMYSLAFWLSRNHACAFISTLIAVSITEMGKVANLQFFYPSGVIMVIFPISFIVAESLWTNVRTIRHIIIAITFTIILLIGLIFIHVQIGTFACITILIYLAARYAVTKRELGIFGLRIATITLSIIVLLLFFGISTLQLEYFPIVDRVLFEYQQSGSPSLKIRDLSDWYSTPVVIMSVFGLVALSFFKDNKRIMVIAFIGALLLWIYFQQFGHIQRIMVLERPILAFAAGTLLLLPPYLIWRAIKFILHKNKKNPKAESMTQNRKERSSSGFYSLNGFLCRSNKYTILYLVMVLLVLFPVFLSPYDNYLKIYLQKGYNFVNFTEEEIATGKWINENTPKSSVIYSDPSTVIEMRGLGFRKNIEGIGWNITVANEVKSALATRNVVDAYNNIKSNIGNDALIVITPRTSEWLNNRENLTERSDINSFYIQWPIEEFRTFKGLDKFFDKRYFDLIYRNEDTFIFKLI